MSQERLQVWIDKPEADKYRKIAQLKGISLTSLIRTALDEYIKSINVDELIDEARQKISE